MKVLFLDVDDVLNDDHHYVQFDEWPNPHKEPEKHLSEALCANLKKVLDRTGCKVVLSSTWRKHFDLEEMHKMLLDKGVDVPFVGQTLVLTNEIAAWKGNYVARHVEIRRWLNDHAEDLGVTQYAIVDDDPGAMIPEHFVQTHQGSKTEETGGLRKKHVEKLVEILNSSELS